MRPQIWRRWMKGKSASITPCCISACSPEWRSVEAGTVALSVHHRAGVFHPARPRPKGVETPSGRPHVWPCRRRNSKAAAPSTGRTFRRYGPFMPGLRRARQVAGNVSCESEPLLQDPRSTPGRSRTPAGAEPETAATGAEPSRLSSIIHQGSAYRHRLWQLLRGLDKARYTVSGVCPRRCWS